MDSVSPKTLLIQWRFTPWLDFNARMTDVGLALNSTYKDWQRNANVLILEDTTHKRAVGLSSTQCDFHFESIEKWGSVRPELKKVHDAFQESFKCVEYTRFAVRARFAIKTRYGFSSLVERFHNRFHVNDKFNDFLGLRATISDTSYTVEFNTSYEWHCALSAGPMKKDQWFKHVPYAPRLNTRAGKYEDEFPAELLYVDVDFSTKDVAPKSAMDAIDNVIKDAESAALSIYNRLTA